MTHPAPLDARAIIEDLRKGVVPIEHIQHFTVGRDKWLRYVRSDLVEFIAEGGSKVRFINGDYGDGKTHFMTVVRHLALAEGFAVSSVVLTAEVPLHRFETVHREVLRRLKVPGQPEGIRAVVDAWLDEGVPEDPVTHADALRSLPDMDRSFANALIGIANLHRTPGSDPEQDARSLDTLYRWLEGDKISKRELKPFHVFESLDRTNTKRMLAALVSFLRHLGHRGFVLFFDEVETVMARSTTIRNAAYENIRLLIDSADHTPHVHIFLAVIPDVLVAEKGFRSYDALWSRVRTLGDTQRLNYRSVLVDLHRTPLVRDQYVDLGRKLRNLHGLAFDWDSAVVTDAQLNELCDQQEKMGVTNEIRLFIRQLVQLLDHAEQGAPSSVDLAHAIAAQAASKRAELSPSWDS